MPENASNFGSLHSCREPVCEIGGLFGFLSTPESELARDPLETWIPTVDHWKSVELLVESFHWKRIVLARRPGRNGDMFRRKALPDV
jgi:hypothetical protein